MIAGNNPILNIMAWKLVLTTFYWIQYLAQESVVKKIAANLKYQMTNNQKIKIALTL